MTKETIASTEDVARLIHPDWIEDGVLMHEAFMLKKGETYISVNRPSVEDYGKDLEDFLTRHTAYSFPDGTYKRALLNVGKIRDIQATFGGTTMDIDVAVEPRDTNYKSHAGIFTRYQGKNLKPDQYIRSDKEQVEISTDSILLEVRMNLLDHSTLETFKI